MPESHLHDAMARGATIVTPNNRLARDVVRRHDDAQRAAGRRAWESVRAMPWTTFVSNLWQQALDAGLGLAPHRLDASQAAHLWRRIVAQDLAGSPLLDAAAVAALAEEAWQIVHAYGEGASWRGFAESGPEVGSFVRWASAFDRETRGRDALEHARAGDEVARVADRLPGIASLDIACTGFVETSPQQARLLDALVRAGARVQRLDDVAPSAGEQGRLYAAATPGDELAAALAWARDRAEAHPGTRIAIVVHDLHERLAQVRSLAEDVLCPGLQWPGREDAPRPYDVSAGGALADVPVVAAALDLIALAHAPLDCARSAALLRSRYLPGDALRRALRAGVERDWLESNRRDLSRPALAQAIARVDPDLAARWRQPPRVPSRAAPRDFVDAWKRWLDAAGWCDGADLDAAELAARGAWSEVLGDFVRLAAVAPTLDAREALAVLRDAARTKPFEPEAPGARIRILGVLEAVGLSFDAVWVLGLSAEAWPRAPEPNPLLPIAWQRERDVPRATPARELAYARALTARLQASAPLVVFSHARTVDDHPSAPSPLIAHLPASSCTFPRRITAARAIFDGAPALEQVEDVAMPPWPVGEPFRGGAALIDAQGACPFQSAARFRLRAQGWPDAYAGLRPTERGKLVHAAFAAFWREVRDQRRLRALDDDALRDGVARAVAAGRAAVDEAAWAALPPIVAAVETGHVERLMRQWLREVEQARAPFAVEANECEATVTLAGHGLRLRIDRVDRLDDGRRAILDYKTGVATPPDRWFDERPQAPQLALYAMALDGGDVAALAYAQLKPGRVAAVGLVDDVSIWPQLDVPAALRRAGLADWRDAQARLRAAVVALGQAASDGDARIVPREPEVCRRCDLLPLCRKAAADERDDDDEVDA